MLSYLLWNLWFLMTMVFFISALIDDGFFRKENAEKPISLKKLAKALVSASLWPVILAKIGIEKIIEFVKRED